MKSYLQLSQLNQIPHLVLTKYHIYEIIKSLPEALLRVLVDIYNDCLWSGEFPDEWNKYLITFILKGNNNEKARPIALASCLLKIFE